MTPRHDIPTPDRAAPTLARFATLTATTIRPATKTKPATLDTGDCGYIATRIAYHLAIARDHSSQPDGYPRHASGADPSNNGPARLDPDGAVTLTSVEAAVDALARWRDPHDAGTANAYGHVLEAVLHLAAAKQILLKLDHALVHPDGLGLTDDRWCENHLRHGYPHEPRAGDGSLYCRFCAGIHRDCGDYPNKDLIDDKHRYRQVTERMIRKQFPDYGKVGA